MGRESLLSGGPRPGGALTFCQGDPVPLLPTGESSGCSQMGVGAWVLWTVGTWWVTAPWAGTAWHRHGWQAVVADPTCAVLPPAPRALVGTVPGRGLTAGTGTGQEPGLPRVVHILLATLPRAMDIPSNISAGTADRAPLPSPLLLPVPHSQLGFSTF